MLSGADLYMHRHHLFIARRRQLLRYPSSSSSILPVLASRVSIIRRPTVALLFVLLHAGRQQKNNFFVSSFSPHYAARNGSRDMSSGGSDVSYAGLSATASGQECISLAKFKDKLDLSWTTQLITEREPKNPSQNNLKRPVKNGHYVLVDPKPLRDPRLVLFSEDMAAKLRIQTCGGSFDNEFVHFFSGNVKSTGLKDTTQTWATPYALSIMGTRYTSNCPFGTGDGYGDGRAISIAEVSFNDDQTERYELQLKGAGPTPFCRGADGRAVLRSSIREFLASEAMHHLGISTTRALSLIVSEGGDVSNRPWYSDANSPMQLPSIDDPRLARFPIEQRKQFIEQLSRQKRDPDIMIQEPNAITCRVAPSFMRVGHIDLFSRRAAMVLDEEGNFDTNSPQWQELSDIIWHAAYREFYEDAYVPYFEKNDLKNCVDTMLRKSAENIARMVAGWVRVGFAQGNFNGDNCLIAGRTMDYGPFGFMDRYDPKFAKWTGSGEHFGFLRQPTAGYVNFAVLVDSMTQALRGLSMSEAESDEFAESILEYGQKTFQKEVGKMWSSKLGFDCQDETSGSNLWIELEPILRESQADWTLFWRQLTLLSERFPIEDAEPSTDFELMFSLLEGSEEDRLGSSLFYEPLKEETKSKFLSWIETWRNMLKLLMDGNHSQMSVAERMRRQNPKYILREWMLVNAYTKASQGDESVLQELNQLIQNPYDEGTKAMQENYYRRAPDDALTAGGTAFMS